MCSLGMEGAKLERLENQNGELGMGQMWEGCESRRKVSFSLAWEVWEPLCDSEHSG